MIFRLLGADVRVQPVDVEERDAGTPHVVAEENAQNKARAAASLAVPGEVVLGCDTVVGLDGVSLNKPRDRDDAERMLRALRGRTHEVVSACCVVRAGKEHLIVDATEVRFRDFDDATLAWYLDTGEWHDRAGAYAIQEQGAVLGAGVNGDWWVVVGFPTAAFLRFCDTEI